MSTVQDETSTSVPEPVKAPKREMSGLTKITLGALVVAALVFTYFVIADQTTPFSGDARVQAFVVRIAPEVSGQVSAVEVGDNSLVEQGDVLFRIDPTPFQIAVDQAEANLQQVGLTIGVSTAQVEIAQSQLDEARVAEANARTQSARALELVKRGVYTEARATDAQSLIDQTTAAVSGAEADLRRAQQQLGPQGEDNPLVRDAIATLENARFQLSKTTRRPHRRGASSPICSLPVDRQRPRARRPLPSSASKTSGSWHPSAKTAFRRSPPDKEPRSCSMLCPAASSMQRSGASAGALRPEVSTPQPDCPSPLQKPDG